MGRPRSLTKLTATFTAPPEFTVFNGRTEVGRTDPDLLTEEIAGPRKLLLAGRSWLMTYIDWSRRRCFVEPAGEGGRARWSGFGAERVRSFTLARAVRDVLLGENPPVRLTGRATVRLAGARDELLDTVHPAGTVVTHAGGGDVLPEVAELAVCGLKFGDALPPRPAEATLAARSADEESAGKVPAEPVRWVSLAGS